MARRIQRHWPSSCQDVGGQSTTSQQTPSSNHLVPTRKLSLGSLTSQDSSIPQHTSRRLSTLSLQNIADERSNSYKSRNHDYHSRNSNLLNSKFGVQGGKDSPDNFTLSLHRHGYLSDTDESTRSRTRKDYLTAGRRSLSLFDSKGRDFLSMSTHRDSSASDCDVYGHHSKPLAMAKDLPPLPFGAGLHGQRREVGRSSSGTRQRSTDVGGNLCENHLNGSSHILNHSTIPEETAYDRPHHSSSLPSITRTKENKCFSSYAEKELKTFSNSKVDSSCNASVNPKSISSYSGLPSQVNNSKFDNMDNSSSVLGSMSHFRSKYQDRSLRKSNSNATSSSEYKGRSQIPSLLHFRSPTMSYEVEKQRKVNVEEGTGSVSKPRSTSLSRCTPDRSVLSKFFRQSSGEKDRTQQVQPAGEEKNAAKKKRRISRFLRPDFFDTPREESIYAKEKDASKADEEKNKWKSRKNIERLAALKNGSPSQVQAVIETGSLSSHSEERLETNLVTTFSDSVNADRDNINVKNSKCDRKQMDDKNGEQIKSVKDMEEKSNNVTDTKKTEKSYLAFEKLANNVNRKSQFLHSLEKKLEKFRSSGDCIPSASISGKSRVDKAICSLREQSLAPRSGDIITSESHLLKRAVSVSDCYTVEASSKNCLPAGNENARSKLKNKVTSVLGLFRNLEDTPGKTCQSSPLRPSLLSRLRRTQSVYAGSHSDSVLLEPDAGVSGSSEFKSFPPLCLKKLSPNSSVVKKEPVEKDMKIQMGNVDTNKSTETHSQNPGLNTFEHPINRSTELPTENMLGSETVVCNSNTTQEISALEGNFAMRQQESSVPKLLKRGSIKSKTKNIIETSNQAQSNNDVSAHSDTKITSVLEHGKCLEEQIHSMSVTQGGTKPDRPNSLIGLKGTVAYKGMRGPKATDTPVVKLEMTTNLNDDVGLPAQDVASDARAMYIASEAEKCINHLGRNKSNCVRRGSSGHISLNICTDACNADKLESCTMSGVSPTRDAALVKSAEDEDSLNDDEIKFANVKRLNSYLCPAGDSTVLSPPHDLESSDSRSVCSDFENLEFPQLPVSPPGDDVEESVGDRILRKSFYSRFNDVKKKHRKSSLSSVGSFPFSYQDPNSVSLMHHPRKFFRKKDHSLDYVTSTSHSVHLPVKSHRSQSLCAQNDYDDRLASCSIRSPIPYRSQHSSHTEGCISSIHAENMTNEMSGYVDEFRLTDKNDLWDGSQKTSVPVDEAVQTALSVGESVPVLGGSTETPRMPRHFQHNVNSDTLLCQPLYSDTMIRGSDSHLSRSTESCIGTNSPKSHLPTIRDRHLSLASGFATSKGNCVAVTSPDSAVPVGALAGESLPLHGKCNR
jgi:hypothetical protein